VICRFGRAPCPILLERIKPRNAKFSYLPLVALQRLQVLLKGTLPRAFAPFPEDLGQVSHLLPSRKKQAVHSERMTTSSPCTEQGKTERGCRMQIRRKKSGFDVEQTRITSA